MKITNIKFHDNDDNCFHVDHAKYAMIINSMLQRKMYSDALFDRAFIDVTIKYTNDIAPVFYRLLWEDSYLKIPHPVTRMGTNNEVIIGITVSEALGFIFKATPPRLQDQIVESHKSISAIVSTLKTFLMEGGQYINYCSMFYEHIHLKTFDTTVENFGDIVKGANTLMDYRAREINMVGYVYNSLLPFSDIFKTGLAYNNKMMVCMTTNGSPLSLTTVLSRIMTLRLLPMPSDEDDYFENITVFKVDNVVFAGNRPYILLYVEYDFGMEKELFEMIKESYEGII